jgi:hypothetical protein
LQAAKILLREELKSLKNNWEKIRSIKGG